MFDFIPNLFAQLQNLNTVDLLTTAGGFLMISLILGWVGKVVFGPGSALNHAVSSAIGIVFIYVVTIVVISIGGELEPFHAYLSPLPFIQIDGSFLELFVFEPAGHDEICVQLLSMVILSFLVNLFDTVLPRGEQVLTWFFWRCVTIVISILTHWFVTDLLTSTLPGVLVANASAFLLGLLVLMLGVGALKFLVGAAIATVNPIIGVLYTFFFANIIGLQLSKAVLTTAILSLLVYGLNTVGVSIISISVPALMGYLPYLAGLAVVWYIVNRVL